MPIDVRADAPDTRSGKSRSLELAAEEILVMDVIAELRSRSNPLNRVACQLKLMFDGGDHALALCVAWLLLIRRRHAVTFELPKNRHPTSAFCC